MAGHEPRLVTFASADCIAICLSFSPQILYLNIYLCKYKFCYASDNVKLEQHMNATPSLPSKKKNI